MKKFDLNCFAKSDDGLEASASTVVREVCGVKAGERVLIITNPSDDVCKISFALYNAACDAGAAPVVVVQPEKSLLDFADEAVVEALKTEPAVILSISANKLGKDMSALANPYRIGGKEFTSAFNYVLDGKKCSRGIWTPGISAEIFCRSSRVDYAEMRRRCKQIAKILNESESVRIVAPSGTDLRMSIKGREAFCDDGDFTRPGSGGNIPAGEVFISPVVASCRGRIAFDGSMALSDGTIKIERPIVCELEGGYISKISGGNEARLLEKCIKDAQDKAAELERRGTIRVGVGAEYAKNATHIGELGIGLNPAAIITGNMLEDEKAFRTCHFAIGSNYDRDAESLIHLDGVVKNPTIVAEGSDGSATVIEENGEIAL